MIGSAGQLNYDGLTKGNYEGAVNFVAPQLRAAIGNRWPSLLKAEEDRRARSRPGRITATDNFENLGRTVAAWIKEPGECYGWVLGGFGWGSWWDI